MREGMFRKTLVYVIIVLFIGVAALPSVAVVDFEGNSFSNGAILNTENDEQVEIIVELWKPDGVQNYSVWLTQEDATELHNLTNSFKLNLDSAVTFEETIVIYVDMIISLYELGLLPDYLDGNSAQPMGADSTHESECTNYKNVFADIKERLESAATEEEKTVIINEAIVFLDGLGLLPMNTDFEGTQQLVNGDNFGSDVMNHFMPCDNNNVGACENFVCLTSGESNNTHFYNGVEIFLELLYKLYYGLIEWAQDQDLFETLPWGIESFLGIPDAIAYILDLFTIQTRLPVGHLIGFGCESRQSADGWVHTLGLNGIKEWDGSFYGQISTPEDLDPNITNVGTIGFTGIKIIPSGFYLGAALWVKIGSEQPGSSDNQKELSYTDPYTVLQNSQQIISNIIQPDSKPQDQSNPQNNPSPQNQQGSQQSSQQGSTTMQSTTGSTTASK